MAVYDGGKSAKLYIHVTVHRNRFLFNNQPDALINQIFSVIKLHVSGIFSAHHQEFYTVHSALVSFMQFYDVHIQAESECSILTLLGYGHHKPALNLPVPNVQQRTPEDE